jgi:hypothetical protein
MKTESSEPLSPELKAELEALEKTPDSAIDLSDMPEITDWSGAVRGKFYRPVKQLLSVRLGGSIFKLSR